MGTSTSATLVRQAIGHEVRAAVLDQVRREFGPKASDWLAFDAEFTGEVLRPNAPAETGTVDLGALLNDVTALVEGRRRLGFRLEVDEPISAPKAKGHRDKLLLCLCMLLTAALRHESVTASTTVAIWADGDHTGATVGLTTPRLDDRAFDLAREIAIAGGATLGRTALEDRDVIALNLGAVHQSKDVANESRVGNLRIGSMVHHPHLQRVIRTFCRSVRDISEAGHLSGPWDLLITDNPDQCFERCDVPVLVVGASKSASALSGTPTAWLPTPFSRTELILHLEHLYAQT
ncbi:MAG: hypothetical protein AAGD32_12970 [Planctomycetota bacterium]